MVWWLVIVLATLYLLLRLMQMSYWFVTHVLLSPNIALPLKGLVLLSMGATGLGGWLWLKRRNKRSQVTRQRT